MKRLSGPFLLGLVLLVGACSDDDKTASDGGADAAVDALVDLGNDMAGDVGDTVGDAGDLVEEPDSGDVASDGVADADVNPGTGTIAGNIFNNTGTTDGTLTVALSASVPVVGEPDFSVRFEGPSAPIQAYEFLAVPVGTNYYVVAHWDVGDDDSIDDPGDDDLLGQTEDTVELHVDGETYDNANVEVF